MTQKISQLTEPCPCCGKNLTEVGFRDNHGQYSTLEIHCSTVSGGCGYSRDAESGEIRNQGIRIDNENASKRRDLGMLK